MAISHKQPVTGSTTEERLTLPFIDTNAQFDLRWLVLLLPVWWWLGIEQFIWPVFLTLITVKVLYRQQCKIIVLPSVKWFGFFIGAILISSWFIVEDYRWLTFIRNFGAFISGFLILLIIINQFRSWRSIDRLLNSMLIVMVFSGFLGILAASGIWRPTIESLAGRLLPDSVAGTNYGQVILIRTLGVQSWFIGLNEYFRVNGFFLFSNHYASAIIIVIPLLFFKLSRAGVWGKIGLSLAITLLMANLILTTSRVALLGLTIGGFYFVLFHSFYRRTLQFLMILVLALVILIVLVSALVDLGSPFESGIMAVANDSLETFIYARGAGSFTGRSAVYQASFEGFRQRPFFGWGTERDVPGLTYPAGSHSEYIAVMYRQGLVGMIAFLGLIISSWRMTRPPKGPAARTPEGSFMRFGRWLFVASLINSIATDPAVDTTVYVMIWLVIGLMIASARLVQQNNTHASLQY
jgi:O-antigen ligase